MVTDNNKVSFLHRVLNTMADENQAMDEIIKSDLLKQMQRLVDVMGGLRDDILDSAESDREAVEKLQERVNEMRLLREDSDDPEALDDVLEEIEALMDSITPRNSDIPYSGK